MRKVLRIVVKIAVGLLSLVILAAAVFAAFNWTMTRNMIAARGKSTSETAHLAAQQPVAGCAIRPIPAMASENVKLSTPDFAKMRDWSEKNGGFGLLVMQEGQLEHEAYRKGFLPSQRTQTFSMNKTITALMFGIAQRDGLVGSVDLPASRWLTEWQSDSRRTISLKNLLTMSSGLKNYTMVKGDWAATKLLLSDGIEQVAIATPADVRPGTVFKYENANAQLIGAVLRRALAKSAKPESYANYLSRTLWCGVGNAPATLWAESDDGAPRFYAGLQASLQDWGRIGQLILDGGKSGGKQIVPAAWIAEMTGASATNPQYGYFIWRGSPWHKQRNYSPEAGAAAVHSAPYAADDVIFIDGYGGQRVYIIPSAKLVIARTGEMNAAYDDSILVNMALKALNYRKEK